MMTEKQIHELSPDAHQAWIDGMSEDEKIILHTPVGYRYVLVSLAEVKWFLSTEMPAEYRLKFLEFIDSHADMFTPEAIAAVDPMPAEGREMIKEARKLGRKWLDVVARWEVFNAFISLNPSMMTALRLPRPNGYKIGSG